MLVNKAKDIPPPQKVIEHQGKEERGQRLHYLGISILTMELDHMTYISTHITGNSLTESCTIRKLRFAPIEEFEVFLRKGDRNGSQSKGYGFYFISHKNTIVSGLNRNDCNPAVSCLTKQDL